MSVKKPVPRYGYHPEPEHRSELDDLRIPLKISVSFVASPLRDSNSKRRRKKTKVWDSRLKKRTKSGKQ